MSVVKVNYRVNSHAPANACMMCCRGAGGYWRRYDATQLATPEAFEAHPSLVWEFYSHRREVAITKVRSIAIVYV